MVRLAFLFFMPSRKEGPLQESSIGGVESREILAQRPPVERGEPEGQNLGALVAPCG